MRPSSHLLTEGSRSDPVETSSGRGTSCIGAEYGWRTVRSGCSDGLRQGDPRRWAEVREHADLRSPKLERAHRASGASSRSNALVSHVSSTSVHQGDGGQFGGLGNGPPPVSLEACLRSRIVAFRQGR